MSMNSVRKTIATTPTTAVTTLCAIDSAGVVRPRTLPRPRSSSAVRIRSTIW
jgi:hypothetical protein